MRTIADKVEALTVGAAALTSTIFILAVTARVLIVG